MKKFIPTIMGLCLIPIIAFAAVDFTPDHTGIIPDNYFVKSTDFAVYTTAAGLAQTATLHFDSIDPVFEDYSTANVDYKWDNVDSSSNFGNLSTSISDGSITVLSGGEGKYFIHAISSFRADAEAIITTSIFKNGTSIDNVFREQTLGPARALSFLNISANGATQDFIANTDSSSYDVRFADFTSTQKALDATANLDGIYYHVNETNATPGFLIKAEAERIDVPNSIVLYGAYDGANHNVKMEIKNDTLGTYTSMTDNGSDFFDTGALPGAPGDYSLRTFDVPDDQIDYVDSSGKVIFRIRHINTGSIAHDFELDRVTVMDRLNSIVIPNSHEENLVVGDKITLRYRSTITDTHFLRNNTQLEMLRTGD